MTRTVRVAPPSRFSDRAIAPGRLVLVSAAEMSTLDLLLAAVRRRMPESGFEFPMRIATRRSGPAGSELAVPRSTFRDMQRDGGLIATWEADGHSFGLPDSILGLLVDGRTAIVAAPADVAPSLQAVWPRLRVLCLTGQLDAARAPLTPRACLRRIVGPRLAVRLESRAGVPTTELISHAGDLASAVRALSEALQRLKEEHEQRRRRPASVALTADPPARRARPSLTPAAL